MITIKTPKESGSRKPSGIKWLRGGTAADILEKFVKKGQEIAVSGKLTHRSYEASEGDIRYITEVKVSEVLLLSKKQVLPEPLSMDR